LQHCIYKPDVKASLRAKVTQSGKWFPYAREVET